jgi:hypothetical protein
MRIQLAHRHEHRDFRIRLCPIVLVVSDPLFPPRNALKSDDVYVEPSSVRRKRRRLLYPPIRSELNASFRFILSKRQVIIIFNPSSVLPKRKPTIIISAATDQKMPAHYIAKANREKLGFTGMDKITAFDTSQSLDDFAPAPEANSTGTSVVNGVVTFPGKIGNKAL